MGNERPKNSKLSKVVLEALSRREFQKVGPERHLTNHENTICFLDMYFVYL